MKIGDRVIRKLKQNKRITEKEVVELVYNNFCEVKFNG